MNKAKVDDVAAAAVNAAINECGNERQDVAIVVVVRPLRGGESLSVATNVVRNERVVASVLRDGARAVDSSGTVYIPAARKVVLG